LAGDDKPFTGDKLLKLKDKGLLVLPGGKLLAAGSLGLLAAGTLLLAGSLGLMAAPFICPCCCCCPPLVLFVLPPCGLLPINSSATNIFNPFTSNYSDNNLGIGTDIALL
jgi:hypothetical protein